MAVTTPTGQALNTPDPFLTQEQLAALAATLLTNVVLLFKLDISDAQQAALLSLVNGAYFIFVLVHAAYVRGKRAEAVSKASVLSVQATNIQGSPFVDSPPDQLPIPEDGDDRKSKPT